MLNVSEWQFYISLILMVVGILTYTHRISVAKKAEINQKVDNVTFESFKKETTTELDCKLNKDAFFRAEKNYESIDKRVSAVEQSAIKSNLKYVESFGAIQTDLSWIRRELDNQRKDKGK
jgi:hypothetical protein